MHRVFVYGTLRRGESHASLLSGARYLGGHVTEPRYTLCDLGEYPAAASWGSVAIHGEVYEVSDELLGELDRYEEYPQVYDRRPISTAHGMAWMYLLINVPAVACVIAHGNWCRRNQFDLDE